MVPTSWSYQWGLVAKDLASLFKCQQVPNLGGLVVLIMFTPHVHVRTGSLSYFITLHSTDLLNSFAAKPWRRHSFAPVLDR